MSTIEAPTRTPVLETETTTPEAEKPPESVINLLLERQRNGYRRGVDKDGRKIGLAFDPGGYAGVVSVAMARKLEVAGLLEYVDAFYGLSAGGLNAAYAAAGQTKDCIDCYVNMMVDNGLVTPPSILPPKLPAMNLNVVREAIYNPEHPLKMAEVLKSKVPVVIGVTDLSIPWRRDRSFMSTKADPDHPEKFIEQMIAGCNIPVIAGGPITGEDGHKYTDGTMAWGSSIELAAADYCTDILSLANSAQPDGEVKESAKSRVAAFVVGTIGNRYLGLNNPPKAAEDKITHKILHPLDTVEQALFSLIDWDRDDTTYSKYSRVLERKAEVERAFTESLFISGHSNVERLYPPDIPGLPELLTADKKRLRVGIRAGRLAVRKALQAAIV